METISPSYMALTPDLFSKGKTTNPLSERVDKTFLEFKDVNLSINSDIQSFERKISKLNQSQEKGYLPPLDMSDLVTMVTDIDPYFPKRPLSIGDWVWNRIAVLTMPFWLPPLSPYILYRTFKTMPDRVAAAELRKGLKIIKEIKVYYRYFTASGKVLKDMVAHTEPILTVESMKKVSFMQLRLIDRKRIQLMLDKNELSDEPTICWSKILALKTATVDEICSFVQNPHYTRYFYTVDEFLEEFFCSIPKKHFPNKQLLGCIEQFLQDALEMEVELTEEKWLEILDKLKSGMKIDEIFSNDSVTLIIRGKEIIVSERLLLSMNESFLEEQKRSIDGTIEIDSVSYKAMKEAIAYMKTGILDFYIGEIGEVMQLAEEFKVDSLLEDCVVAMRRFLQYESDIPRYLEDVFRTFFHIEGIQKLHFDWFYKKLNQLSILTVENWGLLERQFPPMKSFFLDHDTVVKIESKVLTLLDLWVKYVIKQGNIDLENQCEGFLFFFHILPAESLSDGRLSRIMNRPFLKLCSLDAGLLKICWEELKKRNLWEGENFLKEFCSNNPLIMEKAWIVPPDEILTFSTHDT